jgi:hypothetical protein
LFQIRIQATNGEFLSVKWHKNIILTGESKLG